jgi:large subunit ribosomal protein L6
MSRVGLNPVAVPDTVTLSVVGQIVTAKGKLGELSVNVVDDIEIIHEENLVRVKPRNESTQARAMWGTTRSLVQNIVTGVDQGFTINLEIVGVGYRAAVAGKELVLQLGFSHEVRHPIPEGISIKCERPTAIAVSGSDRQLVGQVAANIREYRKPEPYKGKGVRYENEFILRKEGKKK